jgi:hypothetical protein
VDRQGRTLGILLLFLAGLPLSACGARSGLLSDDRASDGGADGGHSGVDAARPACDQNPVRAIDDPVWEVASAARTNAHAFFEPSWDRIAVYGGGPVVASTHYEEPVISVELEPPSSHALTWSPEHVGWQFGAAARDDASGRVFVVGGWIGTSSDSKLAFEVSPKGPDTVTFRALPELPIALRSAAAAFDADEKRLVLFGGLFQGSGDERSWELYPDATPAAWNELESAGGPDDGADAAMVWAPSIGFLLLASPSAGSLYVMRTGTTTWESIAIDQTLESGRAAPLLWDEKSCTLSWWGGGCEGSPKTIRLKGGEALVDDLPAPAILREFPNVALDPIRDYAIVHGGYDCSIAERFETVVAYPLLR